MYPPQPPDATRDAVCCHANFIAYRNEMPYTPSNKVAKHEITAGVDDLRMGSYDAQSQNWITD